jgi:hypothetical protein
MGDPIYLWLPYCADAKGDERITWPAHARIVRLLCAAPFHDGAEISQLPFAVPQQTQSALRYSCGFRTRNATRGSRSTAAMKFKSTIPDSTTIPLSPAIRSIKRVPSIVFKVQANLLSLRIGEELQAEAISHSEAL